MIKLEISIESPEDIDGAITLLQSLTTNGTAPAKPKKAAKKAAAKAEPEPEESSDNISIDEVRAALAEKVEDHRKAIKKQLTNLGAKNVTNLDPDLYGDFLEFLSELE